MGESTNGYRAYAALGTGLALIAVYVVVMDNVVGTVLYLVIAAYGTALSFLGAAWMPPARRRIWWAFAVGQALFLLGDLWWTLYADVLRTEPFPSIADVFYLAQYPVLALGMLWLVRGRRRGRDRAAFLDAAIFATGVTVVGAVFFIGPAAESGGSTLLSQVVAAAYPVGDLLVLAMLTRVFTTGIVRNAALWGLFGGLVTLLAADLYYVVTVAYGMSYPDVIELGFLASYVLLGFAVLHPSVHELSEPTPERPEQITVVRLVILGGALALAPVTDQVAHLVAKPSGWVVLIGGCVSAVLVVLRLGDLVHSLERTAVQLAALARKDQLTGIPNRRSWDHELSRACALAREEATPLSVAVIDMDHFKLFNDTFGHLMGDLVLKETAAAWSAVLNGRGVLARFGGEEFTTLIPDATTEDAVGILDQMRHAVTHDQTCSIGLATWDGLETPGSLVARADRALYHAKRTGRDRIAVDDGQVPVLAQEVASDPSVMPMLTSVYQPIVELRTGELLGQEALTRFDGLNPRVVFDEATRDGTAPWLEAAAIRSALAGWDGVGALALNVSPSALVTAPLQAALPAGLTGIILEITESDLLDYTTEVMLTIDALRDRGALVAIDDFGIGFSNIQRVVTLRPDIIKLDITLVRGIDADTMLQGAVAAIMLFAEQTRAQVVAEGIETPEERECLIDLGVHYGQGYLLGVPAPAAAPVPAGVSAAARAEVSGGASEPGPEPLP